MRQNDLVRGDGKIYRILCLEGKQALVVDCGHKSMPFTLPSEELTEMEVLPQDTITVDRDISELSQTDRAVALRRYSIIANVVAVIADNDKRIEAIRLSAEQFGVSRQTVRNYLYDYLVYQDISVLAPMQKTVKRELTREQKNMRWALNA